MTPSPEVRCKKCGEAFQPELKTKDAWACPKCRKKNPNLGRHYKSVADLYILWLLVTMVVLISKFGKDGLGPPLIMSVSLCVLLLITIILIYRSAAPWNDVRAKVLIWVVFGVALLANLLFPLIAFVATNLAVFTDQNVTGVRVVLHGGQVAVLIIYPIIFTYLLWLQIMSNRCSIRQ